MKLLLLVLALISSGCTTLFIAGPQAIVEKPETAGDHFYQESFVQIESIEFFKLTDSASSRPLTLNSTPTLESAASIIGGANFLAKPKLTFGGAIDVPALVAGTFSIRGMIKYQLIGESYTASEPSAHSVSVYGHPIYSSTNIGGDQEYLFGPGGYPWYAKAELFGANIGATYGYRFSDKNSVYAGVAHMQYHVNGKIHQSASEDGVYPEVTASFPSTHGRSTTFSLGTSHGSKSQVNLSGSYTMNKWGSINDHVWYVSLGLNMLNQGRTAVLSPVNR